MYFDQVGNLNAIRYNNWKLHFAILEGNIASAVRVQTAWPKVINLRADPFERAWHESEMYLRWMAENMWLFVPAQVLHQAVAGDFHGIPAAGRHHAGHRRCHQAARESGIAAVDLICGSSGRRHGQRAARCLETKLGGRP